MHKKNLFKDPFVYVVIGIIGFILISLLSSLFEEDPTPHLQGIESDYQAGEKAKTALERQEAFNHSLKSLLYLEEKHTPTHGNGKLYLDIGNNFFQLQEYPKAILYYNKARLLRPRDNTVNQHLAEAQAKLGINEKLSISPLKKLLFFHYLFSIPERLQLFSLFALITFCFCSAYLWYKRQWLYYAIIIATAICCIVLMSLMASYYFSPLEGVMQQSSNLYRDAGQEYAKVIEAPLPSGMKVKILDVNPSGKWMKIETGNGVVGYVPYESLQLI